MYLLTNVQGTPPFPSELTLIRFVAFCFDTKKLAYSTIKIYLSGIRFLCLSIYGKDPMLTHYGGPLPNLQVIMRGLKKSCRPTSFVREPITLEILNAMCQFVKSTDHFGQFNSALLAAAMTLAFWGFLRCGEFTVLGPAHFDPEFDLTYNAVSWLDKEESSFLLTLKHSKCDPWRQGVSIYYGSLDPRICPVFHLRRYLIMRPRTSPDAPIFLMNGGALTRAFFIDSIRTILSSIGLEGSKYHGHSFRKGAATSAATSQIEDHLIKRLGRWSSDCYNRYISTDHAQIVLAQRNMCQLLKASEKSF